MGSWRDSSPAFRAKTWIRFPTPFCKMPLPSPARWEAASVPASARSPGCRAIRRGARPPEPAAPALKRLLGIDRLHPQRLPARHHVAVRDGDGAVDVGAPEKARRGRVRRIEIVDEDLLVDPDERTLEGDRGGELEPPPPEIEPFGLLAGKIHPGWRDAGA